MRDEDELEVGFIDGGNRALSRWGCPSGRCCYRIKESMLSLNMAGRLSDVLVDQVLPKSMSGISGWLFFPTRSDMQINMLPILDGGDVI